jgi:protein-L-isoaspartate O-methyltransferase
MESAHYFSTSPAGPFTRKPLTVELAGETRRLQTSTGIFSPDGIDKGTAVLLAEVPAPHPQGNLLDIGCGWGPIALTMALLAPGSKVYAVDVNERCVALTNENAASLGLTNVAASTPSEVDANVRFDTIWSNPPIRIGKEELHALLKLWLPRLADGGTAWLVVQKNLGSDSLQRWLAAELDSSFSVTREGYESVPLATMTAGPLSSTCSWPAGPAKNLTPTTPPGTLTRQASGASGPAQWRMATAAAQAPVPQDWVSPTPRSWTRMVTEPTPSWTSGSAGTTNSTLVPFAGTGSTLGAVKSRVPSSSLSSARATTVCG